MSDTVLKFIPADPQFIPAESRQRGALAALIAAFPDGHDAETTTHEELAFIDNGVNTEAIICPTCGARLALHAGDRADEHAQLFSWIFDADDAAAISSRPVTMPCCGAKTPAVAVAFDWPAGFAHFELSIWNPNTERPVDSAVRGKLEDLLGCPLREIWAHY